MEFDKESKKLEPQADGLVTPAVERDVLAVQRARPQPQPVDVSSVVQVVTDFLKRTTLNGYPIDVQAGNIAVSPAAMSARNDARAFATGGRQVTAALPPIPSPAPVAQSPPIGPASDRAGSTPVTRPPGGDARRAAATRGRDPTAPTANNTPALYHRPADPTGFGSTLIPVKLKRADGERTIIAYLDAPSGYVVEGAGSGERTESLPGEDTYYNASGGGDGAQFGFALRDASDMDGHKVLILDGFINDEYPSGMGADNYILAVSSDSDIWAVITYDTDTLEIDSRSLDLGASTPESVFGTIYFTIGYVWFITAGDPPVTTMHLRNAHCGNIDILIAAGAVNGTPAVLPVLQASDPVEYPEE